MIRFVRLAVFLALLPSLGFAGTPNAAVDRGRLSLAWDAHQSGLFEEALGYLAEIEEASPVAGRAAWLRAECLYGLERYPEAAAVLNSDAARSLADRDDLLLDVYSGWIWEATSRQAYGEALKAAEKAMTSFPGNGYLGALAEAARFRRGLAGSLEAENDPVGLGKEASIRRRGAAPPDAADWEQAYPWDARLPWVPQSTLADWMPELAAKLGEDRVLWLRMPESELRREIGREARKAGLEVVQEPQGARLRGEGGDVFLDKREWAYRAAAEGLGSRGAALQAIAEAVDALRARSALARWIEEHRGQVETQRAGNVLRLRNPETNRAFELDLAAWAENWSPESDAWADFWSDATAELGRPARPFRCFCGREVQLRETLVADPGRYVTLEKEQGFATAIIAMCPHHQQLVTPELLKSWGVGWAEAGERARSDAVKNAWDLIFERGEVQGGRYVVLEGEGVSGLARRPELLLGALEAVDGLAARGRAVQVVAASPSLLVVSASSELAAEAGAAKVLLAAGRRGEKVSRVGYRTTVRLPMTGIGSFRLRPAE